MRYSVLGPLEVERVGHLVQLGPYRQRAVLALLVLHVGEVVPFDVLIDQLWSGEPPEQSAATLQAYISRLRGALEPDRDRRAAATILVTRAPGYVLDVAPSSVDSVLFAELVSRAADELAAGDAATARRTADEALGLWRGEAYADFRDERFVVAAVARLEELRLAAIELRAEADLALGREDLVVPELGRLVGEHPLRERMRAKLMLALYRSGRQAEALRLFDEGRLVLAEELGLDPNPEIQDLQLRILRQDPSLQRPAVGVSTAVVARGAAAGAPTSIAAAAPTSDASKSSETAQSGIAARSAVNGLVGRDRELALVDQLLDDAFADGIRVLLVSGEAGIGKTALAEASTEQARARGAATIWSNCWEGEGAPPLWPWITVCRDVVDRIPRARLASILGDTAADLALLVPEVKEALPDVGPPAVTDPDAARFRLYRGVAALLRGATDENPLLIVIEDVHWADLPSLRLLRFVVDQLRGVPVAILATYRREEVGVSHPAVDALTDLAAAARTEPIWLRGLDREDACGFLAQKTGLEVPGTVADVVHTRAEGNPYFMAEFARLLASEGSLTVDAARAVPAGVREVIARRVRRLPEDTRTALSLSSIVGRTFGVEVLADVMSVSAERALDVLEPAVASGLVREAARSPGDYEFVHALVRETLYEEQPAIRRARMHALVADTLVRRAGHPESGQAAELANHYLEAGRYGDPVRAVEYAVVAADLARGRYAHDEAEQLLLRALEVAQSLAESPERARLEMRALLQLGALHSITLGYSHAKVVDDRRRAIAIGRQLGPSRELLTAMWGMWGLPCVTADFPGALAVSDEMLALADESGNEEFRIAALLSRGWVSWHLGEFTAALDDLGAAQALADPVADSIPPELLMHHPSVMARAVAAHCLATLGRDQEAATAIADAFAVAQRLGDPFTEVVAALFGVFVAITARDAPTAERRADAMVHIADRHGFAQMAGFGRVVLGWARAMLGAVDEGLADIKAGLDAAEGSHARMLRHFFLTLCAEAQLKDGRPKDAQSTLARAIAEFQSTGEAFYAAPMWLLQAEVLRVVEEGEKGRVEEALAECRRLATAQGAKAYLRRIEAAEGAGR